jgi:hypothetical protein
LLLDELFDELLDELDDFELDELLEDFFFVEIVWPFARASACFFSDCTVLRSAAT